MKNILILGATSHIGFSLAKSLYLNHKIAVCDRRNNNNIYHPDIKYFSLKFYTLKEIIYKFSPDVIINCIGLAPTEANEKNKELANQLNIDIVIELVDIVKNKFIKVVHYSTSYVFKGNAPIYLETSATNASTYYGLTKIKGEDYIIRSLKNFLIIRLTSVVKKTETFQRPTLIDIIDKYVTKNKEIKLINDIFTNYVSIDDVVSLSEFLINSELKGIFHIGGDKAYSPYELGLIISKIYNKGKIIKTTSEEFYVNSDSKRGKGNFILSNKKIKKYKKFNFEDVEKTLEKIFL